MLFMKSADLIGHIKFLLWRQLNGYSVTRPSPQRVWPARLQLEMVMWMYGYESLTTPWQAFVLVERRAIHLLNRIAIIQTWWKCRKVGRVWYIQDHNKELLSTVKWFISSCQSMISQMDKIFSKLFKQIHSYSSIVTASTSKIHEVSST